MSSAFHDSQRATILAFALTSVVMMVAFVRVGKPLLMLGVLVVTLGWSMGIITLAVGHLTLFSVMFIPIVIGVGIDYGNYYLFRYEEEMLLGRKVREALERTGGAPVPACCSARSPPRAPSSSSCSPISAASRSSGSSRGSRSSSPGSA